jgi:hypothetical protein
MKRNFFVMQAWTGLEPMFTFLVTDLSGELPREFRVQMSGRNATDVREQAWEQYVVKTGGLFSVPTRIVSPRSWRAL